MKRSNSSSLNAMLAGSCLLLIACAPLIETPDGRRLRAGGDEFRDYAAGIFRRHNAAAIAIGDAIMSGDIPPGTDIEALDEADAWMMSACEPLDRLAIARRDGKKLDFRQLEKIADAVPACDSATQSAEDLLNPEGR